MGVGVAGSQPQQGAACLGLPRRREVRASIRTQDLTGGRLLQGCGRDSALRVPVLQEVLGSAPCPSQTSPITVLLGFPMDVG